jgi:hypothetical protein
LHEDKHTYDLKASISSWRTFSGEIVQASARLSRKREWVVFDCLSSCKQLWFLYHVAATNETTETFPLERRRYQMGQDLITALGIVGTGICFPMLEAQQSFTLGCAEMCSLRANQKYLAPMHVRLERVYNSEGGIRVSNISSGKNDLVFKGEIAKPSFVMDAGDSFQIGDSEYFALSDDMQLVRPTVMEILGIRHDLIDELLIAAVNDSSRHILVIGEPGCDHERLGRAIHRVSHRRHNRFNPVSKAPQLDSITRQAIRDTRSGTLLVPLYQKGKLDQRFVAMLADKAMKLRLIICGPSRAKIEASFPGIVTNRATEVRISPLRGRRAEVSALLDQWFVEAASNLRYATLPLDVRASLEAYGWPKNLQELRETADYFMGLAPYRSMRQAIKGSHLTKTELRSWFRRLGISFKLPLIPPIVRRSLILDQ